MASPYSAGPAGGGWTTGATPNPQSAQSPPPGSLESTMQTRPMGVKVLYSFKDSQDNCLARCPGVQNVQTVQLDETTTIGVVELRMCLQAVAQCSPEILGQQDLDYTVYALDYSETDTPLVGQGMFSWGIEPAQPYQDPKLVTGRVTKNLLALFGGGVRETLEVKLKLTSVPRIRKAAERRPMSMESQQQQPQQLYQQHPSQFHRQQSQPLPSYLQHQSARHESTPADSSEWQQQQQPARNVSTPTDSSEWTSFVQSNPTLARSASTASVPPQSSFISGQLETGSVRCPSSRPGSVPLGPAPGGGSLPGPAPAPMPLQQAPIANMSDRPPHVAQNRPGTPAAAELMNDPVPKPSRPSSRASRPSRATGRPRGRPPKRKPAPAPDGNTSAIEEPTDADDGPQKKRATITKAAWADVKAPLDSAADSLRIAAATSGSLRTMRPVGLVGSEGGGADNHLQEGPRAPTPVPQAGNPRRPAARKRPAMSSTRRESMVSVDGSTPCAGLGTSSTIVAPTPHAQDARSPTESIMHSDQVYTPEDSPVDLGSSPPVPRSTAFLGSSPMPSSPILPAMSRPQPDSGFMSGGVPESAFDDEDPIQALPQPQKLPPKPDEESVLPLKIAKPVARKGSRQQKHLGFPFQEENPGPPELLPVTSLYNPTPGLKKRAEGEANKLQRANSEPRIPLPELNDAQSEPAPKPATPASLPPQLPHTTVEKDIELEVSQLLAAEIARDVEEEPAADGTAVTQADVLEQALSLDSLAPMPEPELPSMGPPRSTGSEPATTSGAQSKADPPNQKPPVPASDPVGTHMVLTLPQVSFSEAPCPPSDAHVQESSIANKNFVKKQSIKERLEQAILSGETPPFCSNCGAIETPTWRKMWAQEHKGEPDEYEFSEKPGYVTAVDVLERDGDEKTVRYRLVKKTLGPGEDKHKWSELLLCNPCGIWLSKFLAHRPPERWDRYQSRLNQPRKKREHKGQGSNSRPKKPRTKSDATLANPTSETYYITEHPTRSNETDASNREVSKDRSQKAVKDEADMASRRTTLDANGCPRSVSPKARRPGSTHSRGSGTAESPIPIDDNLGLTRRLLFPSPRKDGVPKALGEIAVNIVKTTPLPTDLKDKNGELDKDTGSKRRTPTTPTRRHRDDDDLVGLFGTPLDRPSTPPPGAAAASGPFKTPTRPTPSHRPITRSISKSIRSARSSGRVIMSPSQALAALHRTPSRTPGSRSRRHVNAHFILDDMHMPSYDSPFTTTLQQLLSEAHDFTAGSPSHGIADEVLSSMRLDSDGNIQADFAATDSLDFADCFMSADAAPMPSSPPFSSEAAEDGVTSHTSLPEAFDASWEMWAEVTADATTDTAQLDGDAPETQS